MGSMESYYDFAATMWFVSFQISDANVHTFNYAWIFEILVYLDTKSK